MKFAKIVLLSLPLALLACDESSSSSDNSYGDLRYENHVKISDGTGDCYVYAKGDLFTLVFEQHYPIFGSVTIASQIELGSTVKMHEEVNISGTFPESIYTGYCNEEKLAYEALGGTVKCSKSKIVSDATLGDADASKLADARAQAVSELSESCDTYLEDFEESMRD